MITIEAMRADLIIRAQNMVNDLRHEWVAAGNAPESFTVEVAHTPTGVSVSLVVLVGGELSDKKEDKYTPLSKKKI
jgi:hypothetical protein